MDPAVEWTLIGLSLVNRRAQLLEFDDTWQTAYDPYAFIRDAWLQRRVNRVRVGNMADADPLEGFEDPEAMDDAESPPDQPPVEGASNSATSLIPASETTAGGTLL